MSIIPFPTARMLPGIKPLDSAAPAAPRAIVSDLSAILARAEPPAPAPPPPAYVELPPLTIIARGVKALKKLAGFIGKSQAAAVRSALREEEGQWFMEKMEELATLIEGMPVTYGQDGKGDDAICHLHYFGPNYDVWITEKDIEESENPAEAQWQAHGYTHWAQNGAHVSMGYICLPEILAAGAELDFHFKPRPVRQVKPKLGIEVKEPAAADCLKAPGSDSDTATSGEAAPRLDCLNSDSQFRQPTAAELDRATAAGTQPPDLPNPLAEKQAVFLAMPDGFQVGAILTHSWGYEQTNVDYHRIIKRTKATVVLERLNTATLETGFMCGKTVPVDEVCPHDKQPITRRITTRYNGETSVKIRDPHHATLWDGRPGNCSWYG